MENKSVPNELSWLIPEYDTHNKSKNWYIIASIIAIALVIYSYTKENYTFMLIIVIASALIYVRENEDTEKMKIKLTSEGVFIGQNFHDYDEFKDFIVLYKPKNDIKNLYFEFDSSVKQRLSIPLEDTDPSQIRDFLIRYLDEDLERMGLPVSEKISKFLKI